MIAILAAWKLWPLGLLVAFLAFVIPAAFFLFILSKDLANNSAIENLNRLLHINKTEIEILNHHFTHLPDGSGFKPGVHAYANDLDIFGRASVYQYINRTQSEQGNQLLANWLLEPALPETILRRQQAIQELSPDWGWRQQLQADGMATPVTIATQQEIEKWLEEPAMFLHNRFRQVLRYLLPATSFSLLYLHINGLLSAAAFYPLLVLMLAISFIISKSVMSSYLKLNKMAPELGSLTQSISRIEQKEFRAALLIELKNKYRTGSYLSSRSIEKLKKILDRFDIRLNPLVFIPLNTFLFWDLQQAFALEKWKAGNKDHTGDWYASLAEMESLSSLANLHFNHPGSCFPVLSSGEGVLIAESLGHPLIPHEKIVYNSFSTAGAGQINLVTGSNMAGKSTFLRSIGVNLVLTMMGAPVFAKSFSCSHMKVVSSMRVNDNLEENTSTFYAELKKLKEIIQSVYNNEKVFLLLDEILRGTNSADRHTGSKALIKQLIKHRASGLIATHDLELAKLADEFTGSIHNYHFDVRVNNDELFFDYKLKEGICRSMNASLLMKKIGIEL